MKKKILLIGMLNSIHMANWIERIQDSELEIELFPSRQYRNIHPKISEMISTTSNIKLINFVPISKISTYAEFFLDTRWFKWCRSFSRQTRLKRVLMKNDYHKVHAIEIQHAGYLMASVSNQLPIANNLIVTNWGSDIYFYSQFPEHQDQIRKILELANYYSAECERDYLLARNYGFSGIELPVVPNSTTFKQEFFQHKISKSRIRNQVLMKCYGETFGLGQILLEIAESLLISQPDFQIYAYSVTPELISRAQNMKAKFPERFRYTSVRNSISHEEMIQEFRNSRIYIGASRSDGISTSFLEALATGAYPIQTSTSCANEWVRNGAKAEIVAPEKAEIENAIVKVINDVQLLEEAQELNMSLAKSKLEFNSIAEITKTFYFS